MRTLRYALMPLIIGCINFNPIASIATNCDCPTSDPMAKKSCGPEPYKLKNNIFDSQNSTDCNTNAKSFTKTDHTAKQTIEALSTPPDTKSTREILDYLSCYRINNKTFCHYKTTLASHISLAAESAGLPMAVQSCLFMRETGFQPNIVSLVGATGYVQFMPGIVHTLKNIISGSISSWKKNIEDAKIELDNINKNIKEDKNIIKITYYKKEKAYEEALILTWNAKIKAKETWDNYWEGTKNPPSQISSTNLKCPQIAFALAAMKQTYDLGLLENLSVNEILKPNNQHKISINGMDVRDSAILLAGGYNGGIGSIGRRCSTSKTIDDCLKNFPENHETRKYMSSIRSCAKKNSTEPMSGDTKLNCESSKCQN